jgi:hypothetical protein
MSLDRSVVKGSLGAVAVRDCLQSHGQFDVFSEGHRKIIAGRGSDVGEVFWTVIRVVGYYQGASA